MKKVISIESRKQVAHNCSSMEIDKLILQRHSFLHNHWWYPPQGL